MAALCALYGLQFVMFVFTNSFSLKMIQWNRNLAEMP